MVKKSKPSVKAESVASDKEETLPSGKESEGIDFFNILAGGGALIGIILLVFVIFRYVLHVI